MTKIELIPLKGISIEGIGNANLGDTRKTIEQLLGPPTSIGGTEGFYDQYEFRVDYSKQGKAEFIEFIFGPFPQRTKLSIYGVDPFATKAEELTALLTEKNNGEVDKTEEPYSLTFLNTSIGVWRDAVPANIEEWIQETKDTGRYEFEKEDLTFELEKAQYFWTIGIGIENYYKETVNFPL